jgi:hypothetical protein
MAQVIALSLRWIALSSIREVRSMDDRIGQRRWGFDQPHLPLWSV